MWTQMPKKSLPPAVQSALVVTRRYIEQLAPGSVVEVPIFRMPIDALIDGYAIAHDGGLSLIYINATDAQNNTQWSLHMCASIAIDVGTPGAALAWVNQQNCRSAIDKYFCKFTKDRGSCAVAAETIVNGSFLRDLLEGTNSEAAGYAKALVRNVLYTASKDSAEFLALHTGRPLTASEEDLAVLFAIASG